MPNDTQSAIIFLEKTKLFYFSANVSSVLKFDFPTTAVKDMEVVNREMLSTHLQSFISINKLTIKKITIIMSVDTLFLKDFTGVEELKKDELVKAYIDNIPFEKVAYKTLYKERDKTMKIIATNKELISEISNAFKKHQFEIEAAVPCVLIQNFTVTAGSDLSTTSAQQLLLQTEIIKQFNLIEPEVPQTTFQNIAANAAAKDHPKRLPLLFGVFGSLIMILGLVAILASRNPTSKPLQAGSGTSPLISSMPVESLSNLSPSPTSVVQIDRSSYTIVLNSPESLSSRSASLKEALVRAGYSQIDSRTIQSTPQEKTLILFSQQVQGIVREDLYTIMKDVTQSFSGQDSLDSLADIIITIGTAR